MATWNITPDSRNVLDYAMAKIDSVPYTVTARWVFYQLVQAGLVDKKKAANFEYLVNRARKTFYGKWYPGLLSDSIREAHYKGEDYVGFSYFKDSIREQEHYVQVWFEAEAMHSQFEHYTRDYRVSLVPFRGDCSIPLKWNIAKKLERTREKYGLPIKILYFGDLDPKGLKIFEAAVKDIRAWCTVPLDVERVGLTEAQAKTMDIPENPDRPGCYQWEALNDGQAGQLIVSAVGRYAKKPSDHLLEQEKTTYNECVELIKEHLGRTKHD